MPIGPNEAENKAMPGEAERTAINLLIGKICEVIDSRIISLQDELDKFGMTEVYANGSEIENVTELLSEIQTDKISRSEIIKQDIKELYEEAGWIVEQESCSLEVLMPPSLTDLMKDKISFLRLFYAYIYKKNTDIDKFGYDTNKILKVMLS